MKNDSHLAVWLADSNDEYNAAPTVGEVLSRSASLWPDREAVIYSCQPDIRETRWSYRELNEMAEQFASGLLQHGYTPGDKIAVWGPNHPEWILLEYALAKAGMVIVAINPLYKEAELVYALNTSNVKGIFHADRVGNILLGNIIKAARPKVPSLNGAHAFSRVVGEFCSQSQATETPVAVKSSDVFMIQYTSGTTGPPKAAQLTHAAITSTAKASYLRWGIEAGNRVCHGFPLFHVGGSGNSTPGAAIAGATTLPLYIFKPGTTLDILESEQCSGFIGVPTMLTAMLEHPSFASRDLSQLRYIIAGGSQVPENLLHRCESEFGVEIINCYGQTETCGVTSSTKASDSTYAKSQTSGKPLDGVSVKIVNKLGETVARDTPGQLNYKGPGIMFGYLDDETNKEVFDAGGWLQTGDLAKMDDQGNIIVVGRAREMIIRGGENLSPAEIENYVLEHPDVADVAVIGLPDSKYGEVVCAVIRPRSSDHATPEKMRAWCSERISRWKVPEYIVFVNEFPTTHSGKVQKHLLREKIISSLGKNALTL